MRWFTIGNELTPQSAESPFFYGEGNAVTGAGASVTRSTSVKRSGVASRAHNSGASQANAYTLIHWGLQGNFGYYTRIYFRVSALPVSSMRILSLGDEVEFLTAAYLTPTGVIQLWKNVAGSEAQLGSDSVATVAIDTFYMLELYTKAVSGANDEAALRFEGTTVASVTGQTLSESMVTRVYMGWAGVGVPAANSIIYIDDVAVNDDQGATHNSWPGQGSIVYLNPISDNARDTNWVAGAGGTSNLFDAVDNEPPAGVAFGSATNTSQIKNTNTADTTGNYDANLTTYANAGITDTDTIKLVQPFAHIGSSSATNVSGALRVVSNPAGSEDAKTAGTGGAIGAYPSNWHSWWGTAITLPSVVLATSPVLRIGRRGSEASQIHCAGMRLAVEYAPTVYPYKTTPPAQNRIGPF